MAAICLFIMAVVGPNVLKNEQMRDATRMIAVYS